MARRLAMAMLGCGIALTGLLPVLGIVAMVVAAVALAITLEHDLLDNGPAGQPG